MELLTGYGPPLLDTEGKVGQHYKDLNSGDIYKCVKASVVTTIHFPTDSDYIWELTIKGDQQADLAETDETKPGYVKNRDLISGGTGVVGQTFPEVFGAKGDGVTDDAAAITQALASGKNVVFDGTKTYAVGSTITIPADAHVDFRGATVVPMGNHDVIRVMPGSFVENFIVRCGGVSGWDSAAIVLYGADHFRAINPTTISNVKLYCNEGPNAGLTTNGVGVKLYGDDYGHFIEGITTEEIITYGFGVGMLFEGVPNDAENPAGGFVFIGANKFRGYWSFYDNVAIKMPSIFPRTHITNNIFTDLQIEPRNRPNKDDQSSFGIFCNGFSNLFEGCLYDYFYGHTGVYFGAGSNSNVVKTTSGTFFNPGWIMDYGACNIVTKYSTENLNLVPSIATTPRMIGDQDDCFTYMDKRATCTLESLDANPIYGSVANLFNPTPTKTVRYRTINPSENDRRAKITIECKKSIRRLAQLFLQFYSAPKSIRITYYNDKSATVVYDTDNNVNTIVGVCDYVKYGEDYQYNVAKIVIELGGFNSIKAEGSETYGEWEIVRIMGTDSYNSGDAWLGRGGGEVYGNVLFNAGNGVVLTAPNGKLYQITVADNGALSTTEIQPENIEPPEVATLTPTMLPGSTWYNADASGVSQNEITSVTFNAAYESTGTEDASWPCDKDVNGNIMAYRNGTDVVIKSTTGSEGVKLNQDSKYMFANDGTNANFAALTAINGTETWLADEKTDASNFCKNAANLTGVIYVPDGVTSLGYAFSGCTNLETPPVLPDSVVSLLSAFGACSSFKVLPEIPSSTTNINYAFNGCVKAESGPSQIPAKVTSMEYAFRNCILVTGTIEVNAVKINNYTGCFFNAGRDSDGIVLTGTSSMLAELAATDTNGKVTVATA